MLARKSTLIVANSLLGGVLGYVALKLIALYMGAGEYGQLTFATSLVGTLGFMTNLGMHKAHQKRVSEGRDPGDCLVTYGLVIAGLAGLYIAVILGGLAVNHFFIGKPIVSTTATAIILVTLAEAAVVIRRIAKNTFVARREIARKESIIAVEHVVRVPLMGLFALFYASAKGQEGSVFDFLRDVAPGLGDLVLEHGADFLALAVFAASFASMLVALYLLLRHLPRGKFKIPLFKDYVEFALPMTVIVIGDSMGEYFGKTALGFFWSDAEVGRYYGLERVVVFLGIINRAVASLLFPAFSELHTEGDYQAARELAHQSTRYISMWVVPIIFGITALSDPFIRILLSDDWLAAKSVLGILAFMKGLGAIHKPIDSAIFGFDMPKKMAQLQLYTTFQGIVLTLVLVPDSLLGFPMFGLRAEGAAIATLLSTVVGIGLKVWISPVLPRKSVIPSMLIHWLGAGLMAFSLTWFTSNVWTTVRWFQLPALIAGGAVVYFLVLAILRELKRKDIEFFWGMVHPGEMGSYIREELAREDEGQDED